MPVSQEELRRLATQIALAYTRSANDSSAGFPPLYTAIYRGLEDCTKPPPPPVEEPVRRRRGRPPKNRAGGSARR